jgi:hypothetical protein
MPYSIIESGGFIANSTSMTNFLQRVFCVNAWLEQLEAIRTLVVDQKDLILIAKTEFGKSLVVEAGLCLWRYSIEWL